jgi:hypothetical protein
MKLICVKDTVNGRGIGVKKREVDRVDGVNRLTS